MSEKKPLILALEEAKKMTMQSINEVLSKTGLPAFLMEGIIVQVLSDIRNLKLTEMESAIHEMQHEEHAETEEKE